MSSCKKEKAHILVCGDMQFILNWQKMLFQVITFNFLQYNLIFFVVIFMTVVHIYLELCTRSEYKSMSNAYSRGCFNITAYHKSHFSNKNKHNNRIGNEDDSRPRCRNDCFVGESKRKPRE